MSTVYSTRWKENQWINATVTIHDIICQCHNPLKHLVTTILKRQEFIKEEKEEIQKCLTGTEEETIPEGGFTAGDLEKLFGEEGADAGEDAEG